MIFIPYYPHRITVTINYFALSLNTVNLHGNPYLNCFLSALVEFPAYILSWILFRGFSRRLSMFSTLIMGGLLLLLIQLIPASMTHFEFRSLVIYPYHYIKFSYNVQMLSFCCLAHVKLQIYHLTY